MKKNIIFLILSSLLLINLFSHDKYLSVSLFNFENIAQSDLRLLKNNPKATLKKQYPVIRSQNFTISNQYILPLMISELKSTGELYQSGLLTKAFLENKFQEIGIHVALTELFYQEALAKGYQITDQELNQQLYKISGGRVERYKEKLSETPFTYDYIVQDVKKTLLIEKYENDLIKNRLNISENEVAQYYQKNKEQYRVAKVRHILRLLDPEKKSENKGAYQTMLLVEKKLKGGADFAQLAGQYSEDYHTKDNGGLINNYVTRNFMVKDFEEAAFNTPVGQISKIFISPMGYHILKVEEKRLRSLKEVKDEISYLLISQKRKAIMDKEKERFIDKYYVQILP
ncbi:MAG: peptidylprolyl isomerase [Spirochaetes bacterium]|nr:peptidylprolyl isomerase [Spirochaetota bacterium]